MKILNSLEKKHSSGNQTDNNEVIKNEKTKNDQPEFIIVMGGVCSGKTTLRKNKYANGYENIDAGEIFIELSRGAYYDFPSHLEEKMYKIGLEKMRKSIIGKKNIVLEIIGAEYETAKELLDLSEKINYSNKVDYLECDMEEAWQRNINRGINNISAHFCEPYHIIWFREAVFEHLNPNYSNQIENTNDYNDTIYDEDIEDWAFERCNLSQRKIDLIEKTLGKSDNGDTNQ